MKATFFCCHFRQNLYLIYRLKCMRLFHIVYHSSAADMTVHFLGYVTEFKSDNKWLRLTAGADRLIAYLSANAINTEILWNSFQR